MSIDFAIKDIVRKKNQTYPYILTIALVIALAEFLIYFTTSLGLNLILRVDTSQNGDINQQTYLSGAVNVVYSQFNTLVVSLVIILAFMIVVGITTTIIIFKKRDIAIMKAIGTLPGRLYGFYLLEVYIIFLIGFVIGIIFGLIAFGVFSLIMFLLGNTIIFHIDLYYTTVLFISCIIGIFVVSGYTLRQIGNQKIIQTFSKDIPYNYDASKGLTKIPRWISSHGFNLKIAVVNTVRRKGEFVRYFFIFSMIFLIIFTLALGSFVLSSSSRTWINKSQGENIIVIGHEDVVDAYSEMYEMYSDTSISIDEDDIDFIDSKYLFNSSDISEIKIIDEINEIDKRLIKFCDVEELDGYYFYQDQEGTKNYRKVGQQRDGNFPIIGVKPDDLIQDFEIEGRWFDDDDDHDNMTISDGLAYSFFDYPLDQSLKLTNLGHRYHISGVLVDSFYRGDVGYVDLDEFQEDLNFTDNVINIVLLEFESGTYDDIKEDLEAIIKRTLGEDYTYLRLDKIFEENLDYLSNLTLYPLVLIIFMAVVGIVSLYNYQKGGIIEKSKDFLIMRAIGTKNKSLKRILFIENLFVIIPSLLFSMGFGMLINSVILFDRVTLPPLYIPLMIISILFGILIIFNLLSLVPIMRKIKTFTIKDFEVY